MSARSASRNAAPLDYVTRRNLPVSDLPARILLWIGVGCWLLPLAAGVGALLGFYLTFADSFVLIGGLALVGGGIAAVTAWILVLVAYRVMDQVEKGARERLRRKAKTVIVGTALNFPIAALCAAAFLWLLFNFLSVTVHNASPTPVSAIKLELLGQEVDVGTLAPGERWKGRLGAHRGPAIISWSAGDIRQTSLHHEDADMDDFPWSVLDIHLYPTTAFWETD